MLTQQRYRASLGIGTTPTERLFLLISSPTVDKNTASWNYNKPITFWLKSLEASAQKVRIGFKVWYGTVDATLTNGPSRDLTAAEIDGLTNAYIDLVPLGESGFVVRLDPSNAPSAATPYPTAIEIVNLDVPAGGTGRISIDAQSLGDFSWLSGIGVLGGMPLAVSTAEYSDIDPSFEGAITTSQVIYDLPEGSEIQIHTDADIAIEFWFPEEGAYGPSIAVAAPGATIACGGSQARITTAGTANVRIF